MMTINVTTVDHEGEVNMQEITTCRIEAEPASILSPNLVGSDYTRVFCYDPEIPKSKGCAFWFSVPCSGRLEIAAID